MTGYRAMMWVFRVHGAVSAAVFNCGMALVWLSEIRLGKFSDNSGFFGWHIDMPRKAVLSKTHPGMSSRVQAKEQIRAIMWMLAEPHDGENSGFIPKQQYALLTALYRGVWQGGAEGEFLLLLPEVLAEENLTVA